MPSPSNLLDVSSIDHCDQAASAVSSINIDQNCYNKYESRNYLYANSAYIDNSATVDIMEFDSADRSVATQFSILGSSSIVSIFPVSAGYQPSNFLDFSRSPSYDEGQATYYLIKYLAVLFPSILVSEIRLSY